MCARERYDTIFVFLDILRRPPLKYVEILYFFSFLFHPISFSFSFLFFNDTLLNDDDYDHANVLSVRYMYLSVCLSVSIINSSHSHATSSDHTYPREMPNPLRGTRNLVMMMLMMLNHNNNKTAPPWYRRHLEF